VDQDAVAAPVVELLMAQLEMQYDDRPDRLDRARRVCAQVDTLLRSEAADPRFVKPAALLAGAALCGDLGGNGRQALVGDEKALDPERMAEVLSRVGFESDGITLVEEIVRSVFSQGCDKTAESMIVSDAVQLVLHGAAGEAVAGEDMTDLLHTDTARDLLRGRVSSCPS